MEKTLRWKKCLLLIRNFAQASMIYESSVGLWNWGIRHNGLSNEMILRNERNPFLLLGFRLPSIDHPSFVFISPRIYIFYKVKRVGIWPQSHLMEIDEKVDDGVMHMYITPIHFRLKNLQVIVIRKQVCRQGIPLHSSISIVRVTVECVRVE